MDIQGIEPQIPTTSGRALVSKRGRGRGRGRGSTHIETRPSRSKSSLQEAPSSASNVSQSDTDLHSDTSASTTRYPRRSTRTVSNNSFKYTEDDSITKKRQKKQTGNRRKVAQEAGRYNDAELQNKEARLYRRLLTPLPAPHPQPSDRINALVPQERRNPVFLKMSHWITEHPRSDSAMQQVEHDDTLKAPQQLLFLTPQEGTSDLSIKSNTHGTAGEFISQPHMVTDSDDDMGHEMVQTTPISLSNFKQYRFVPSTPAPFLARKRRRSRHSPIAETPCKVPCHYPGQSVRGQAGHRSKKQDTRDEFNAGFSSESDDQSSLNSPFLAPLTHLDIRQRNLDGDIERARSIDSISNDDTQTDATPRPLSLQLPTTNTIPTIQYGFKDGLVTLMEHSHPELISDDTQDSIASIDTRTENHWTNLWPKPNEQSAQYVLESFRHFQIPTLLFPKILSHGQTVSTSKPILTCGPIRPSEIYLTIATYFHLLALRAITAARTGRWDITTESLAPCSLSNFTLQLTLPQAPHNRLAQQVFTAHFIRSTILRLYSIASITGSLLTEKRVSIAFTHALRVQMQVQVLSSTEAAYRDIHQREHRDALKLGKWLLLHQAGSMGKTQEFARLVAKLGPDICSSEDSDVDEDDGDGMQVDSGQSIRASPKTTTKSWRGPIITTCVSKLRIAGLYYGKRSTRSNCLLTKPPPDGTPISWISQDYMETSVDI